MAHNKYLEAYRAKKIGTRPPQQGPGSRDKPADKADKAPELPKAEKPATPATPPADKPKGTGSATTKKDEKPATPVDPSTTKG